MTAKWAEKLTRWRPHRHKLSRLLPDIVRSLDNRKCFFTGRENYIVIDLPPELGGREYRVFFDVRHIGERNAVLVFVQSAYPANEAALAPHSVRRKKVSFRVLVSLALDGRRTKPTP